MHILGPTGAMTEKTEFPLFKVSMGSKIKGKCLLKIDEVD